MNRFIKIETHVIRITRVLVIIGLIGLLLLCLATLADIFMRYLFNSPIVGVRDTYSLFLGIVISSCFPLCTAKQRHITIRFLGTALGERWSKVLDVFGGLVTIIIFSILSWKTWVYTNDLVIGRESSGILGWPLSPFWRIITCFMGVCVLILIFLLVKDLSWILSYKKAKE